MNEHSIVTPTDLDAAIRAQRSARWNSLWQDARQPRFSRNEWVFVVVAAIFVVLYLMVLIAYPPARVRLLEAVPQIGYLFPILFAAFSMYASRKARQIRALQKLLHGVLTESGSLTPNALQEPGRDP